MKRRLVTPAVAALAAGPLVTGGAGDGYALTAAVARSVSWTGTGQTTPEQLPDAVMETSRTGTIHEVQTIVR
jgi:hypothetical protein